MTDPTDAYLDGILAGRNAHHYYGGHPPGDLRDAHLAGWYDGRAGGRYNTTPTPWPIPTDTRHDNPVTDLARSITTRPTVPEMQRLIDGLRALDSGEGGTT